MVALAGIAMAAATARAQSVLSAAADGRSAVGGAAVLSIRPGTKVVVVSAKGADALVTVEGWVDASRLAAKLDTFTASVDAKAPLRVRATASADGAVLAELRPRTGVHTLGKSGTWMRIRRSAWIPSSALPAGALPKPPAVVASAKPPMAKVPAVVAASKPPVAKAPAVKPPPAGAPAAAQVTATQSGPAAPVAGSAGAGAMSVSKPLQLVTAPGGATVGTLATGAIVLPLAHDHGWAKVRVEAWVPEAGLAPSDSSLGAQLTAADLRADPDGTRGKIVQWDVQVLSLQTADPLRPELARDEPYLLAKGPAAEDALLYLAVPPSLLAQAKALPPLARVLITARVRSGHSEPGGTPILDLKSISTR